ncbi:MAG: PIN domain-containing protein [Polyangiaceae bacterium]
MARRKTAAHKKEAPRGLIPTITFDTGMLIALERRKPRATSALRAMRERQIVPIAPAVVIAEWWRGRTDVREEILRFVEVEHMPTSLCRAAGEALGAIAGATLADAIVMASASLRGGGVVYTSDPKDLSRLARHFPTVRLLAV